MLLLFTKTLQAQVERSSSLEHDSALHVARHNSSNKKRLFSTSKMSSQDSRDQQSFWLSVSSSGDYDGNAQADQPPFPPIELPYTLARYLATPTRDDPFSTYALRDGGVSQAILNLLSLCVRLRRNMEEVRVDLAGLGSHFWYS
ncbi:hypothetical protein LCI18_009555 [Fusarium solani-melongenae]|uniref:Uncharacterized protein n=1 Tax=Fusarium solani subsp. cucurbitae TaxID=2747967 RepID=A0ACD3ZBY1_FUSSC|nr:hypothetical protein LCI18_009555 [Fusarium solani-melongenae]